jgi:hypothetical protein
LLWLLEVKQKEATFYTAKLCLLPSKHQENEFTKILHFHLGVENEFTKNLQNPHSLLSIRYLQNSYLSTSISQFPPRMATPNS